MNERELSASGSDFKARVRVAFEFLVEEFGFEPGMDESGQYSHRLVYRNPARDQAVAVANAFHPVDYGFEVAVDSICNPRGLDDRTLVYVKFKEDQAPGYPFLAEAAEQLRTFLNKG